MKNNLSEWILALALSAIYHGSALAQTALPSANATTNAAPNEGLPTLITPVVTNLTPSVTNEVPKPKPSGANLLRAFAGGFAGGYSISGRTLKFPLPAPATSLPNGWSRNLDFGMTLAQGNSDTLRYSLGVDALKTETVNTTRFRAHGAYGESDGTKDTENAAATLRYERQLTKTLYALGYIDGQTDPIAELDYRFTGILSPGLRLFRSKTTVLNLEAGAGYVEEKKEDNEVGYTVGRAAITAEKLINDHVLIWATSEYIPKISEPSVYFVNSEVGLAAYLTRNLGLNICYQQRYDSTPVEGKKSSDTILSTTLSLNF